MNADPTPTLMSIGRCFVGALHGPSDKANDKVSVVNWNSGIRMAAIKQILQRTTLRASYRHAAQHKCCAQALSPLRVKPGKAQCEHMFSALLSIADIVRPPTIVRDQFVLLSVTIGLPEHLTERRFHDVVVAVICAGPESIPSPPGLGPDKLPQWHARLR
jgi:hypothetical protein